MAKLHNYYVLCPLIDQKSFLGVSEDKEIENVLVTLGRNVVNKYRLSDQKQIGGWTSKNHITSTVVFDKEQDSYVAVFNNNTIKTWNQDSDNLDKTKKYKFPVDILKLLPREQQSSLVIFCNGNCSSLPYALENRKTYESKSLITDEETIVHSACYNYNNKDNVCYVIKNTKDLYEIVYCPLRDELGDLEKSKLNRIKVTRPDDVHAVGHLIVPQRQSVYVLWSDARMTVYSLINKSWKTVGSVPWVSTTTSVSLAWMGEDHIILFGSNTDEDGALIVAYNVTLGVGSCRYPMKMYSEDARLYCFHNRIVLEASNHIGMLPYILETERNLSSLLASHEIIQDEHTAITDWDTTTEPLFRVSSEMKELLSVGATERAICFQVMPPLLEKGDCRSILNVIRDFKDIPESVLVMLLNYTVGLVNGDDVDFTKEEEFVSYCTESSVNVVTKGKFELLNHIFKIPFSDALLIPYLRNNFALNDALFLLMYISYLLINSDKPIDAEYESKLLDWCTLLMDAFYQQYLVTKDDKVTYVLEKTQSVVSNLVNQLDCVNKTLTTLYKALNCNEQEESSDVLSYSIELMNI